MNVDQNALGSVEIGVLACVPVYGNRKQVLANVEQCLVFRDQANTIIKMLLALEDKGVYRFLMVDEPAKIEKLRKGARKLKGQAPHPAFADLIA